MPLVRIEPSGFEFDVQPAESVAEAAWRLGYRWPTSCWGQAECMLCRVQVLSGETKVVPPDEGELLEMEARLPSRSITPVTRLACRLRVTGPGVVVEKKGVVAPGMAGSGGPV